MESIRTKAIRRLVRRRKALKEALAGLLAEPASVSIVGSVSYTSRDVEDLQKEISSIEDQLQQLLSGNGGSLSRVYPFYGM